MLSLPDVRLVFDFDELTGWELEPCKYRILARLRAQLALEIR